MYDQVSDDVQGQQRNWLFLHDSVEVKAAVILGSCDCHTQCVYVIFPKVWMSKCGI